MVFGNGRDDDGRNINRVAFKFGVAFGQDANGGKPIIPEVISDQTEPPAENDHIGGGKNESYFLRRLIFVISGIRVGIKREFNQLAGIERAAMMAVEVELNAGGIGVGAMVTAILHECGHNVF